MPPSARRPPAWSAGWADGLITVNQPLDALERVIGAFRDGGGDGKPVYVQIHVSWAATEGEALAIAHDQWRSNVFPSSLAWNLAFPEQFDAAAEQVDPDAVRGTVLVSADLDQHVGWLSQIAALGVDGDGELVGLTEKLDHLAGLGVTCLWLMPFYPTANRDDGYDITDYYSVDDRLGSLGDFVALVRTAKDRGLRVIVDLVINHTSNQHPWFKSARRSPNSRYRDYYVWQDEPQDEPGTGVVFPDAEDSIWTYDEQAEQYYLHHFYSHQPDVNIGNPAVREEMAKIAGFWLELGVDGFRVDAVPFLLETGGIDGELRLDPHSYLKDLRAFMARRRGDAVLLGEVNLPTEQLVDYFGDEQADEIQLLFAFPLMQQIYLAFARQDARPLADALRDLPAVSDESQWAMFLRNHDELTLDKLSDDERDEVFAAFGPDEDMQLFGRGLRRRLPPMFDGDPRRLRLPPMFDGDPRRLRLAYSLAFSLPGTPVLFYGEEIGMGENLEIEGRMAVRSPMQWSDGKNGGFSDAAPSRLRRPVTEGRFGPLAVNVADQERDPDSLLNWMQRLLRKRRETPEFGWGSWDVLDAGDDAVLAHRCTWEGSSVIALHNLADAPREITLRVPDVDAAALVDLLESRSTSHHLEGGRAAFKLEGFGYRWLRLHADR